MTGFHSELQTANDGSTSQKQDETSDGSTSIKQDKPRGWRGTYTQDPSSLSCNDFKGSIVAGVTLSCNDSASVVAGLRRDLKGGPGLVDASIKTKTSHTDSMYRSAEFGVETSSVFHGVPSSLPVSSTLPPHLHIPETVRPSPLSDDPPKKQTETRHSHQRRFAGKRHPPNSVRWTAQRLHEDKIETAKAILSLWTHPGRQLEVSEIAIAELNQLPDDDVVEALKELRKPKRYVQGTGGRKLTMRVIVTTLDDNHSHETQALLDSGCTGSCISRSFVETHHINTQKLIRPIPVYNADGTLNRDGAITETVELRMIVQDHVERMQFAVTDLGKTNIFIGHDWLKYHNPSIDWQKNTLLLDRCPHSCSFITNFSDLDADETWSTNTQQHDETHPLEEGERLFAFDIDGYLKSKCFTIARVDDDHKINRTNYDYIMKYDPLYGKAKDWKEVVPKAYHSFEEVFTQKDFDKLPESRPWDHAIELAPDFKPLDCKTYNLSPQEQQELEKFIEEHLRTGRIRPSISPMASPFFFVKKKDGKLRPTQDYRKLNEATIKNRYPLPLISELVDRLSGAKVFTKMDVRWGYNNIRIKEGDEWKAAFRTNVGLFEPTVMFFGLTNSPATFQNFMNHIFKDLIHQGVVSVYMDDILVHTTTHSQHQQIVKEVLRILRDNDLFLKPEKCIFHADEVEYLGMIVGKGQIRMDPAKITAIRDWPTPTNKQELQRFLGFCNYYRRFIKGYSALAKPLTHLTGNTPWSWTENEHLAFECLILSVTTEPVLQMPRREGQFRIEADSSDYAIGAVLSQLQDGRWHPIAYLSKSLNETQRNYEIYDKEMLAIMLALEEWRHYLIGAIDIFEIWTDHQNLQYFRQPQKVNRRQARWLCELANYHFTLHHKPGESNYKPDFLSRPPGLDKGENDNENVILLPEHHFRSLFINLQDDEQSLKSFPDAILERLKQIKPETYEHAVKVGLQTKDPDWHDHGDGIITYKKRIYIPYDKKLRQDIICEHHDSIVAGHPGRYKTQELITRDYWWPRIQGTIRRYIDECEPCQRTRNHREKPHNPLHPHAIPSKPWEHISIDLIGPLPESQGYNAVLVIVDRFSKMIILIATNTELNAVGTARIYRDHVWSKHGLPIKIISDRGPQFVAQFMKDLHVLVGIKANPSTAYHPQTDGQTERMNQEVEQYLRLFINFQQDNWADWLPCAEFAYNNKANTSTGYSPFFVNYGRHPNTGANTRKEVKSQSAIEFAQELAKIWEETECALKISAEQMKKFYDRKRGNARVYKPGDKVWLEGQNIATDRPSRKLDDRRYGPFEILKQIGEAAYKLKLPHTWKSIWPVFNEVFLTPYVPSSRPGPQRPLPQLVDDVEEYEVESIVDSKLVRGKLRYLIKWAGYPERHHWTWEPVENLTHANDAIVKFHQEHPSAPRHITRHLDYRPIPELHYTTIDNSTTLPWENGKVTPHDPWIDAHYLLP